MTLKLRTSTALRAALHRVLGDRSATRRLPDGEGTISFPAAQHLNLLFSRRVQVEPEIRANLARLVQPGSRVYDVGANIGCFTVPFARWVRDGAVVAIEPDPGNVPVLEANVRRNGLRNVAVVAAAVSNRAGEAAFVRDQNTGRTSSLEHDAGQAPGPHPTATCSVPTLTLDSLVERFGAPDLVKCDVEGHELAALEGASRILAGTPVLMIEVAGRNARAVTDLLRPLGYTLFDAEKPLGRDARPLDAVTAFNVLALSGEALERVRSW